MRVVRTPAVVLPPACLRMTSLLVFPRACLLPRLLLPCTLFLPRPLPRAVRLRLPACPGSVADENHPPPLIRMATLPVPADDPDHRE